MPFAPRARPCVAGRRRAHVALSALMLAAATGASLEPAPADAAEQASSDAGPPAAARCDVTLAPDRQTVAAVVDGETLRLEDGSEVRLAGAMAPRAPAPAGDGAPWPHEAAARDALAALALGRSVALAATGTRLDRYRRRHAQAFVVEAAGAPAAPLWLQGAMLAVGLARAHVPPGGAACIEALFALDKAARAGRNGIWASDAYRAKPAYRVGALNALAGTFQLVEGRVARASRPKARIHLDFGRDWRWDFSVSVPSPVAAANPEWAASLLELVGKRVLVRGWITRRNGPMIEIEHPSQLEVAD